MKTTSGTSSSCRTKVSRFARTVGRSVSAVDRRFRDQGLASGDERVATAASDRGGWMSSSRRRPSAHPRRPRPSACAASARGCSLGAPGATASPSASVRPPAPPSVRPAPPAARSAPPPTRPAYVAPASFYPEPILAASSAYPPVAYAAPIAFAAPVQTMNSVRPLVVSHAPPIAHGNGGGFGRFLVGLALIAGVSVTAYRNDFVRDGAHAAHQGRTLRPSRERARRPRVRHGARAGAEPSRADDARNQRGQRTSGRHRDRPPCSTSPQYSSRDCRRYPRRWCPSSRSLVSRRGRPQSRPR